MLKCYETDFWNIFSQDVQNFVNFILEIQFKRSSSRVIVVMIFHATFCATTHMTIFSMNECPVYEERGQDH